MKAHSDNRGYVLLMTLVLISLTGVALAGICRDSLSKAVQATQARQELQQRWGTISCQRLLDRAPEVLLDRESRADGPVVSARMTLTLGGQEFTLVFSDEQAKVNVNALERRMDRGQLEQALRELTLQSPLAGQLQLSPSTAAPGPLPSREGFRRYGCLGQIFDAKPSMLLSPNDSEPSAVEHLTCWGSGKVNFRRAARLALEVACSGAADSSDIANLMAIRQRTPGVSLNEAIRQMEVKADKAARLAELLTAQSDCYSLWIIHHDGQRLSYRLVVDDPDLEETGRRASFQW